MHTVQEKPQAAAGVEQIYTGCLAQAAYYIESRGEAAIIDPLRDPEPYLARAARSGAKIRWIFETHFHADFVSGHLDLQKRTGATIVYGPSAEPAFAAHVAQDREEFALGDLTLRVLHTPGHTLESSCFLLMDSARQPQALFTGDTLFLGDVGRPDLAVRSNLSKTDLAGKLYDSLHNQVLPLPDDILLYPGHGAGSACGKHLSKETVDTLGHQKEVNYALRAPSRADFINQVIEGIQPPPIYFPANARLNREGYSSVQDALKTGMQALECDAFEAAANQFQAVVLDTRPSELFAQGHIPQSIHIGLDGQFASWVGSLIGDVQQPILLVTEAGKEMEAVTRLARIGFDRALGYLAGGFSAWKAKGREVETLANLTPEQFSASVNAGSTHRILDVRTPSEFAAEHIAGALSFPLDDINRRMSELKPNQAYLVHCAGGYRSMIAASLLKARGFSQTTNLVGGIQGLKRIGYPLTHDNA
jgi:hydroxyacylglutathione hydrolase